MNKLAKVQTVYFRFIQKETVCQNSTDEVLLLLCHCPGRKLLCLLAPGVAVIEYVAKRQLISTVVNKRNALGAFADTAVKALMPLIKGITGSSLRTLGVDQKLIGKAEAKIPCCRAEEIRPLAVDQRLTRRLGHIINTVYFLHNAISFPFGNIFTYIYTAKEGIFPKICPEIFPKSK